MVAFDVSAASALPSAMASAQMKIKIFMSISSGCKCCVFGCESGAIDANGVDVHRDGCEFLVRDTAAVVQVHAPTCRKYEPVEDAVIVRVVRHRRLSGHVGRV